MNERDAETPPPPRLLVADDDPGFRKAVAFLLVGSGFQVTEARDGREALRALESARRDGAPFEILLLDIFMDGASGWQVLQAARENAAPGEPPPKVLLMTGSPHNGDRARARNEGAAGFLTKPIPAAELLDAIARVQRIPRDIPAIHDAGVRLTTTG